MKLVDRTPTKPATATICFTLAELEFLKVLMQRVGGNPTGTRGHADRLDALLTELGFTYDDIKTTDAYNAMSAKSSGFYFED
jgi:hypothetical protein